MPEKKQLSPHWQTTDGRTARLYLGDVLWILRRLPDRAFHCVVTSPPYWGQRDYSTSAWEGGNSACDHRATAPAAVARSAASSTLEGSRTNTHRSEVNLTECRRCGARRSTQELGLEDTFTEYTEKLVVVFREVRRVLRDDGTFWLNIGDTYEGGGSGLAPGNLVGLPWRVALAMQDDGWVLRQEVIWRKPDCMPESSSNRPTRAHEQLFLFSKGPRYFYDWYAIREPAVHAGEVPKGSVKTNRGVVFRPGRQCELFPNRFEPLPSHRNKRSVWSIAHGAGYGGNHFAAYPIALVEPCILAGTSEVGCCPECGAPWKGVVAKERVPTRPGKDSKAWDGSMVDERQKLNGQEAGNRDPLRHITETRSLGWYPSCKCLGLPPLPKAPPARKGWNEDTTKPKASAPIVVRGDAGARRGDRGGEWDHEKMSAYAEWVQTVRALCARAQAEVDDGEGGYLLEPAVVLDPFVGSGTTALVALDKGRHFVGIDLSQDYLDNHCIERIRADLLGRPALRHLAGRR